MKHEPLWALCFAWWCLIWGLVGAVWCAAYAAYEGPQLLRWLWKRRR